ncbi:hypothetical protein [Larkinella soli]|uniref:hypothetical protein n=1 Tax=Larkinella soli TaxID=1770527 RepID=UPI001E5AC414|nr:hypothetical protein [Larkinella soli]
MIPLFPAGLNRRAGWGPGGAVEFGDPLPHPGYIGGRKAACESKLFDLTFTQPTAGRLPDELANLFIGQVTDLLRNSRKGSTEKTKQKQQEKFQIRKQHWQTG